MEQRLARLRAVMAERGLEALLVTRPENRRYLSGFTGSSGYLLVTQEEGIFLTDSRYAEQAAAQCPHCRIVMFKNPLDSLRDELAHKKVRELGFEQEHVTYAQYQQYREAFSGVQLEPTAGLIEDLRSIKQESELAILRAAAKIADDAFAHILGFLRPGVRELDVALELEFFMRKAGAASSAFDIIVASGKRSSLPHGRASEKLVETGDFVTLDFGAYYQGYCSDITRTVAVGQPNAKLREIYEIVLEAQTHAVANIKAGMTGKQADALARDIIAAKGYGEEFGHTLGHGIGLAVHEAPSLSTRNEAVLRPGMAVTVEPGIYIPDFGGVRIEDDIVITETGNEVLTKSPKELIIIE